MTTIVARRLPPVVPGSILLGSTRDLRRDMLGTAERVFAEYGDVVRFIAGPPGMRTEVVFMFHPDAAHHVLAGNPAGYRKDSIFYAELRRLLGNGLLTSQDGDWQRQRRFIQPLFVSRRVAGYAAAMAEAAEDLARGWRQRANGVVDLADQMTGLTLRVVCRILFGDDVQEAIPVVQRSFGPLGEAARRRASAPIRLPLNLPTPVNRQAVRAQQALYGVCDEIIARRRSGASGGQDLIGLLLDARADGTSLDDAEIRDQVLIFLLAGHETTATALTYALHLLGRHPDVQRRVRDEVGTVVADRAPTAQDLSALPYTTMVLKEAMRLYPSAPFIGRRAAQDDLVCGFDIPAGTNVVLAPWVIHRHPQFWDDPGRFDPMRFTAEQERSRHRYAWFPFGGGPRACIGQHFSMVESLIVLAVLVREFEFSAPRHEPAYTSHITLRPTSGVPSFIRPL